MHDPSLLVHGMSHDWAPHHGCTWGVSLAWRTWMSPGVHGLRLNTPDIDPMFVRVHIPICTSGRIRTLMRLHAGTPPALGLHVSKHAGGLAVAHG